MLIQRDSLASLIFVVAFAGITAAATKPLYEISISRSDAFPVERYEKAVLEDVDSAEQTLAVSGYYSIVYPVQSYGGRRYQARTDYVADKNGYRAKFQILLMPSDNVMPIPESRLGIDALKSSAG